MFDVESVKIEAGSRVLWPKTGNRESIGHGCDVILVIKEFLLRRRLLSRPISSFSCCKFLGERCCPN